MKRKGKTLRVQFQEAQYFLGWVAGQGFNLTLASGVDGLTRPHTSPSAVEMYFKCGEQYRRRYLEKEIMPPGIVAHSGSGMHYAARQNFAQKLESFRDLSPDDAIGQAVAEFERKVEHDGVSFTDEEVSIGADKVIGQEKDRAALLATAFLKFQAPDYQPVTVEQRVEIPLPQCSHDMQGVVDLVDTYHRVPDFKTKGRKISMEDVIQSTQLTFYARAVHQESGTAPTEVRFDSLITKKRSIDRQVLSDVRTETDYHVLAARVNAMLSGVQKGNFPVPPTSPSVWWCSPKWCGYWKTCPYVNSDRKQAAERIQSWEV
jgi:hypothetical protein